MTLKGHLQAEQEADDGEDGHEGDFRFWKIKESMDINCISKNVLEQKRMV